MESCYYNASWGQDFEGCSIFPDSKMLGGSAADIAGYFATDSTTMLTPSPTETMPADFSTLPHPYTYPYQFSGVPCCSVSSSFSHANFLQGSSVEESPLSSPSSDSSKEELESMWGANGCKGSACNSPLVQYRLQPTCPGVQATSHFVSNCSAEQPEEPHGVKMPQSKHLSVSCAWFKSICSFQVKRNLIVYFCCCFSSGKGGIQLWQFLYALLTDSEHTHPELIEWTCNREEREFRFLEPEAIAIWWGHHKNKPTMNYDKFSRSLRYYYDKGILKKIQGERFVYRFCVDPKQMYKHIGISDCTHLIKPMPEEAKRAICMFRNKQNRDLLATVAQAPEPLKISGLPSPSESRQSFNLTGMISPHEEFPHLSRCPSLPGSFSDCMGSQDYLPTTSAYSTSVPLQNHLAEPIRYDNFDVGGNYGLLTTASEAMVPSTAAYSFNHFTTSQVPSCSSTVLAWS